MPVEGVLISEDGSSKAATSDQSGRYLISVVRSMTSTFVSSKPGYVIGQTAVTISGDTRLDIEIVRVKRYTLSGVVFEVTSAGNVPVVDAWVYCIRPLLL